MKNLHTLAALMTLALAASAGAAGTAAGSTISNTGYVDYTDDTGTAATATSTAVSATVAQVYAVSVTPDGTTAAPGQTIVTNNTTGAQTIALTYTLTNPGNGTDSFALSTYTAAGAATTSANVTTANVKYYADTDASGGYSAGDVQITGNVTLAADATAKFFAVYPVPANAAGGTNYDLDPQGTSQGDTTKTDFGNVGRITVKNVYDLSFAASQASNITTPGTAVYTQTLTNTGNSPLTAAQIALSASAADTVTGTGAFTQSYTVTYGGATTASFATPQAAINAALGSPLATGASLVLNTTVTANNALSAGNKEVLTLGAAITGVTNSTTANNNEPTSILVTDTSTVIKGAGAVTKTQALCGTSGATLASTCPPSSGAATTGINVRPGDFVVYYLSATNTGTGNIYGTKVRDALPAGVSIYSLAATSTQAGAILYSTNGTAWTTSPATLTVNNGATVYAAVDTNADGTITAADTTTAGKTVLFRVKVKVNDGTVVQTAPVTDAQTVN